MKICPACDFENDDGDPICHWCDANIADAKRVPHPDPSHPEHERIRLAAERRKSVRHQMVFAVGLYACIITAIAAYPGMVWVPRLLCLYFASAAIVGWLVASFGYEAKWLFCLIQGGICVALIYIFGPPLAHPFTPFVLLAQGMLPLLLGIWCEMIYEMNI